MHRTKSEQSRGPRSFTTRSNSTRILLVLLVLVSVTACARDSDPTPANILLISLDTLRSDHLSSYGYVRETSPALDRFAAEGARFALAYSQAASTVPSHASLLSGRLPVQHQTYTYRDPLPEDELTLAEVLREHGYRTLAVTSSVRFVRGAGFAQGFDRYHTLHKVPKNERSRSVTQTLLEELDAEPDRPFFAFAHYFGPHEPYAAPAPYRLRWHPGLDHPKPELTSRYLQGHRRPGQHVSPEILEWLRALYDAEIRYLDDELARLFAALDERQIASNTIVVVTSDHGEEFKEHGGLSHARHLHEELVRVPLLVRWPRRLAAGQVIDTPAQGIDILPTLLAMLSLPAIEGLPGRSFATQLLGSAVEKIAPPRSTLIATQQKADLWALYEHLPTGRFKLLIERQRPPQLFRLDEDPGGHIDQATRYEAELRTLLASARSLGLSQPDPADAGGDSRDSDSGISPEVREQLRAIGYADEVEAP